MTENHELLTELIAIIGKKLAASASVDWRSNMARMENDNRDLEDFFSERYGARFTLTSAHDHCVVMAGIRSTSTTGLRGALRNWLAAAQRRLDSTDASPDADNDPINLAGSGPVPIELRGQT